MKPKGWKKEQERIKKFKQRVEENILKTQLKILKKKSYS